MNINNLIYLQRKNKIFIKKENSNLSDQYLCTILKNVESFGYTFSKEIIDILKNYTEQEAIYFYKNIIKDIKMLLGADVNYKPMYPNFPSQVMQMNEVELYLNAIIHYISFGNLMPKYEIEEKFPLISNKNLTVINLGDEEDFKKIFSNLLKSKTSISELDKNDITWFFDNNKDLIKDILPSKIPLKESVAFVSNLILKHIENPQSILKNYYNTATDVLRFATELSNGDCSLKDKTIFKKFSRKERRMLLSLLEHANNIQEDMLRYKNEWIRLGETLHPFEYKDRYKKVFDAFYKIRNNIKIETFNSKIEYLIKNNDIDKAVSLLLTRPSEFARRLDHVLRLSNDKIKVIDAFKSISNEVSSTVLFQVIAHFENRNNQTLRTFIPKGNVSKIYGIENNLESIEQYLCDYICSICKNSLTFIYSKKEALGRVYISSKLKNYTIPFSQRSASKALKTISRGSKLDIDDDYQVMRCFIYWKDGIDRTDIDLSGIFYDENWIYKSHISFTNLREKRLNCCHSGDITSAPHGASEFIDMDFKRLIQNGIRYVVMSMYSYTEQPYCDLPICYMGWMRRDKVNSGEVYEPKTVEQKIDVSSNTTICIPMILDLVAKKIIWTDLSLTKNPTYSNTVEDNFNAITLIGQSMCSLYKTSLYDLFTIHANARGLLVLDKDEADIVFDLNGDITPYDIDVIVGEYL